jgi:hypothetical protein
VEGHWPGLARSSPNVQDNGRQMANLPALGGDSHLAQQTDDTIGLHKHTGPAGLHRHDRCRLNPVRHLQNHPSLYSADNQKESGWPVETDISPHLATLSTLPDYVGKRNRSAFWVIDLGLILRSPRQFARHSLVPAAGCSEGEKAARVVHSDRPFQPRWELQERRRCAFGHFAREICFVVMIKLKAGSFAPAPT